MCQNDPIIIEEYRNPLIESCKWALFSQPSSSVSSDSGSGESIYLNLTLFWINLLNDIRNQNVVALTYLYALKTIKTIYLSSSTNF